MPSPHTPERSSGRLDAEVVIVGAGLTGLSTALHLLDRDPGREVLIVDAQSTAAGASGHGTGLLGPRIGPEIGRSRRRYSDATARLMYDTSVAAVQQVLDLVDRLEIDCGLRTGDQLVATRSPREVTGLRRQAEHYAQLGLDVRWLGAGEVSAYVDVPYRGALRHRPAATLDPVALTYGLAEAVTARGGRIVGGLPVSHVETGRLSVPGGHVTARTIVIAVNAYAPALRLPVGTLLPLQVHAVATEPLPEPVRAALGGSSGCAVIESGDMSPYYRLTPEGRLVVGGGPAVLTGPRADRLSGSAWRFLGRWLSKLHPGLCRTAVTHRWSGRIAMTPDGLPVVGWVPGVPGVLFGGGCCGHGLALSVATGDLLAAAVLTESADRALPWLRGAGQRVPVHGPARTVLRAYLALSARRARRMAFSGL